MYALEGSIAYSGSLIQWLRDNLNFFESAKESENMALQVNDNGGCYFVPAFSGLFGMLPFIYIFLFIYVFIYNFFINFISPLLEI